MSCQDVMRDEAGGGYGQPDPRQEEKAARNFASCIRLCGDSSKKAAKAMGSRIDGALQQVSQQTGAAMR